MLRIEWEDKWINTLIDAGCNPGTARTSYLATYGRSGPDFTKNPAQEAMALLGAIKISEDFESFSEKTIAKHINHFLQRSSKLDLQ